MAKVIKSQGKVDGVDNGMWLFWCPGCQIHHFFKVPKWTFNGDVEKPTVSPSILIHGVPATKDGPDTIEWRGIKRCHSFVRDGRIQFLDDCEHELRGKTVDLPDIEE